MSDVRALLKAKRQEAKVSHPFASYSQSGQLRCIACGTLVKHASAWEGHLGSKSHRLNVAKLKEEEKARELQRVEEEEERHEVVSRGKRKAESDMILETKRIKPETMTRSPSGPFPSDFFSDPSRVPPIPYSGVSEGEDEAADEKAIIRPAAFESEYLAIDLEYERFQREVLDQTDEASEREAYVRATVMAEPELVSEAYEGMPTGDNVEGQEPKAKEEMTAEELRLQREREDRELIMDRLLEEERAQEEADMKATVLRARVEAVKKKWRARAAHIIPGS